MASIISLNDEEIKKICVDITNALKGSRCYGSVDIKRSFKKDNKKATVYFTNVAWAKIKALVNGFSTEVQWHGLVKRIDETSFEIYDILVPPHEVSAATVVSDSTQYNDWINNLDDNTFNAMRFHGHSHVDMGVTPSGVDDTYRKDLVSQMPAPSPEYDPFYIFMIFNKKRAWSGEIYDFTNNTLYETEDITVEHYIDSEGNTASSFVTEAKKVAVEKKYQYNAVALYNRGKKENDQKETKSQKRESSKESTKRKYYGNSYFEHDPYETSFYDDYQDIYGGRY